MRSQSLRPRHPSLPLRLGYISIYLRLRCLRGKFSGDNMDQLSVILTVGWGVVPVVVAQVRS